MPDTNGSASLAGGLRYLEGDGGNISSGDNPVLWLPGNATEERDWGEYEDLWFPGNIYLLRGVILVLLAVLGTALNVFMVAAIAPNRRLRTVRNVLLVHLGSVGLAASLLVTLHAGLVVLAGQWLGGNVLCQIYSFLNSLFTCVSVWTIAALSWDKYQTIAAPLHHSLTATVLKMAACFSAFWLSGLLMALPPLCGVGRVVLHPVMGVCAVRAIGVRGRTYTAIFLCAAFLGPFCLMVYCYAHIFRIARTQSSRIAATMVRMVSVIQAPIAPATPSSLSLRGTKAMGTILQLIGSFVLTYIPYAITLSYEVATGSTANSVFVSIATTLFQAAPFTNAAVYGLRNKILRASFYRYARRKMQRACYKDRRRGSVKSLTRKSSSILRMSTINRKLNMQNGGRGGEAATLRRTRSLQAHSGLTPWARRGSGDLGLPRPHSFNVMNGLAASPAPSARSSPNPQGERPGAEFSCATPEKLRPSSRVGGRDPRAQAFYIDHSPKVHSPAHLGRRSPELSVVCSSGEVEPALPKSPALRVTYSSEVSVACIPEDALLESPVKSYFSEPSCCGDRWGLTHDLTPKTSPRRTLTSSMTLRGRISPEETEVGPEDM